MLGKWESELSEVPLQRFSSIPNRLSERLYVTDGLMIQRSDLFDGGRNVYSF